MLDKFYANFLLFPQLQVSVYRSRDDEIRSVDMINFSRSKCDGIASGIPCNRHKVQWLSMHKAFIILIRRGKMLEEYFLMRQDYKLGLVGKFEQKSSARVGTCLFVSSSQIEHPEQA